jgi:hypothetical protein
LSLFHDVGSYNQKTIQSFSKSSSILSSSVSSFVIVLLEFEAALSVVEVIGVVAVYC